MTNGTPLEAQEQVAFVSYLELNGLKLTSIPNSTYTKSFSQKRKNHAEGLRPGFSDLVVLIAPDRSKDGEGYFLCIEMKRIKGGVQSSDQKDWQKSINELCLPNVQYYLCRGANEAIKTVNHYLATTVSSDVF